MLKGIRDFWSDWWGFIVFVGIVVGGAVALITYSYNMDVRQVLGCSKPEFVPQYGRSYTYVCEDNRVITVYLRPQYVRALTNSPVPLHEKSQE